MANEDLYRELAESALSMMEGCPRVLRVAILAEAFQRVGGGVIEGVQQAIVEAFGPEFAPPGALKAYVTALVDVATIATQVAKPFTIDEHAGGTWVVSRDTDRYHAIERLREALARVALAKGTNAGPSEARPEAG